MFRHTELPRAPWKVVNGNDKRRARLEAMRYVSSVFGYGGRRDEVVSGPDPLIVGSPAALRTPSTKRDLAGKAARRGRPGFTRRG